MEHWEIAKILCEAFHEGEKVSLWEQQTEWDRSRWLNAVKALDLASQEVS